jgi:hypothetical protein
MVGSVIHNKNDGLSRIGMHQQVFEKLSDILLTAKAGGNYRLPRVSPWESRLRRRTFV